MSRGRLSKSDWKQYGQEIPVLDELEELLFHDIPLPETTSLLLANRRVYQSWLPVAWVCFKDAYESLWGAHYALYESIAHDIWYRRKKTAANEGNSALFGRFYADDAALRLYSAAEHLANGIIMMLEISDEELEPYRERRTSQQSIVGRFLRKHKKGHPITEAVTKLAYSKEWRAIMSYRGKLVHEQPPTIKGLGIVYSRKILWEPSRKGQILRLGAGEPEFSVDDLIQFVRPAMSNLIEASVFVMKFYLSVIGSLQNANDPCVD